MRLEGKIAIITAAGSGAGRGGALIFSKEGARVVVGDINPEGGEETVKMIKGQGGEAIFVLIDAGKVDDMKRLINTTIDVYGRIDILWNHAGIPGPGILEETEEADFDRAMAVNIKGGFFATKFAVPHMKGTGGGSIIFTGSVSSLRGSPWSPSYSLFKGGLITFTMALAAYLGPFNIRTNCICPALIDTPMNRVFFNRAGTMEAEEVEKAIKDFEKKVPLRRGSTPEDIAKCALFLACEESAYVNGATLVVDGGLITQY